MIMQALGQMVIIELEKKSEDTGSFSICIDNPTYVRGKVISVGPDVQRIQCNETVMLLANKAHSISSDNMVVVVNAENIHVKVDENE